VNLQRRIKKLEERAGLNHGARHILISNIPADEETGWTLEILPGLFADVLGKPLTEEEIGQLRERYR
jgi:hypothetical protein